MKKKIISILSCIILSISLIGCGASNDAMFDTISKNEAATAPGFSSDSYSPEYDTDSDYRDNASSGESTSQPEITGEKLVYNCTLEIETLNYPETIENVKSLIKEYNGIIESELERDNAHNWYYENYIKTYGTKTTNITIRIPTKNYENFLNSLDGNGKIISKNSTVKNITKVYYETDTYIKSLEKQQERLLEMMDKATTIQEMISVESRLTEVQYQLNNAKNKLATMDNDVEYSTITMTVSEVLEYSKAETQQKNNTFFDRLKNTISDAFESFFDILEFLLFAFIRLIPIAIIFVPITYFIVKLIKKRKNKKEDKK